MHVTELTKRLLIKINKTKLIINPFKHKIKVKIDSYIQIISHKDQFVAVINTRNALYLEYDYEIKV